jgi:hypothetical protein
MLIEIAAGLYVLSWMFGALSVFNVAFPMTTGSNAPPFKWTPWTIGLVAFYTLGSAWIFPKAWLAVGAFSFAIPHRCLDAV